LSNRVVDQKITPSYSCDTYTQTFIQSIHSINAIHNLRNSFSHPDHTYSPAGKIWPGKIARGNSKDYQILCAADDYYAYRHEYSIFHGIKTACPSRIKRCHTTKNERQESSLENSNITTLTKNKAEKQNITSSVVT
jgi:hypothetical protein